MKRRSRIYLGTIALEVNRHAPGKHPTIRSSDWASRIQSAGFDGVELWENHVLHGPEAERSALRRSCAPVQIFNTYADFTDDQEPVWREVAQIINALGAGGVKYNFGAKPERRDEYLRNVLRFAELLPVSTKLLCECHAGTIAERPATAADLLERLGTPERFGAIVHTRSQPAALRAWFEALGQRISHSHVFLPRADLRSNEAGGTISFRALAELGYSGTYTIEFVEPMNTSGETASSLFEKVVADLSWVRETLNGLVD